MLQFHYQKNSLHSHNSGYKDFYSFINFRQSYIKTDKMSIFNILKKIIKLK